MTLDQISAKLTTLTELMGEVERDYEAKKASHDHEKMVSAYASVGVSLDNIDNYLNGSIALAESAKAALAAL